MAAISVQGLTKRFGDVLAVDQLNFEIDQGTVAGFLGPNGAGKTTTLRMLLGLVAPTSGTATVPWSISKLSWSTASTSPKRLVSPCTLIAAMACLLP